MPIIHQLANVMSYFDVISFDIFDTLLLRPLMNPQDVWRVMEEDEGATGFAKARRKADARTYYNAIKRGVETSLDEAYALMPKWSEMKPKELACEERLLVPNSEMVALWKRAGELGKKRVIVSDMYLPADFIKRVLRKCGIDDWDSFYLSSERGVRKSSGKLFEVMLGETGVSPERVMHIGDNRQSDVIVPERLGIASFEYVKVRDRFLAENPFIVEFLRGHPSLANDKLVGALCVGWHQYKCMHPDATYWNRLGFLFGGMLGYMYVSWVVKVARERGILHLMFAGRDGYIWRKICRIVAPDIKADYFYAPRTISIVVNGAVGNDPGAVRDRQRYIDDHGLARLDSVKALSDYRVYLQQFGIEPGKVAVVDGCSSGFSAQRLLETSIGRPVFAFYLLAMAPVEEGAALYSSNLRSIAWQHFSEFIFGSPEPPILGIMEGKVAFKEQSSPFEQVKTAASKQIACGATDCAEFLNRLGIFISPQSWMDYFEAFSRNLAVLDMENLSIAKNSTDVAHRKYVSIMPRPDIKRRNILSLFGRDIMSVHYSWEDGAYCRTLFLLGRYPAFSKRTLVYRFKQLSNEVQ